MFTHYQFKNQVANKQNQLPFELTAVNCLQYNSFNNRLAL